MNSPCEKTEVIDIIKSDVSEIKHDIKSLLEFKNKALGIILAISTVVSLSFNVIVIFLRMK